MRVLMQSRQNLFTLPGGDTIQLLKTKEYLERRGVNVDISTELEPDLSEYDIVHLFNLTRVQETYFQARNAKKQNKKIILSTIYWPSDEFERKGQVGIRKVINNLISINNIERLKAFYKYYIKDEKHKGTKYLILNSFNKMQNEILQWADWFLPNSYMEMEELGKRFNFNNNNYTVVPNAIDADKINNLNNCRDDDKYIRYKDYILCVGRLETRKNQLNLIKALKNTNYKVLFIGNIPPGHKKYGEKVINEIRLNDNFEYIEKVDNSELYKIYKQCKVHILPSWLETPGLVSLEAAVMGCNIVVSDRGTTKDYFKDYAYYCSPNDIESILNATNKAMNDKYDDNFRKHILNNYTWEKAAEETEKGYKVLLSL